MLREAVTVSLGEGNSAVNAAWEYGDFDGKASYKQRLQWFFCLTTCYTYSSNKILFDTWMYRASAAFT